ncbi:hypothetical protein GWK47_027994 [Chionoecetes opilio]|uniref:Uncharacterized protein n=1 Tax=Chionoecetes opilio TaxID=41210 RepID=A0A8J4YPW8_CHIOP|nr:hypothetical protein GWK47_027994 [Chionoecetes opilio]
MSANSNFEHDSCAATPTVQGTLLAHQWLSLFDQMDFLMATAIHPLFKLPVVRLLNHEKVDAVKSRLLFEVTEQTVLDTSEGSSLDEDEEDDFFKVIDFIEIYCIFSFEEPRTHSYRGYQLYPLYNKMGKELESWCSEKQRNKLLEQAMFPPLPVAPG